MSNLTEVIPGGTGTAMLFSAGTFLYVATVHVLPEVGKLDKKKLFLMVSMSVMPLLLSLGHSHWPGHIHVVYDSYQGEVVTWWRSVGLSIFQFCYSSVATAAQTITFCTVLLTYLIKLAEYILETCLQKVLHSRWLWKYSLWEFRNRLLWKRLIHYLCPLVIFTRSGVSVKILSFLVVQKASGIVKK